MFVHVMDPSSQALTLQTTAWGSKDLKHCNGALGATRPSAGTNATTYTLSVHCDRWSINEFQLRLQSDLVGKSQSRQRSQALYFLHINFSYSSTTTRMVSGSIPTIWQKERVEILRPILVTLT